MEVILLKTINLEDAVEIMEILLDLGEKGVIKVVCFSELNLSRII